MALWKFPKLNSTLGTLRAYHLAAIILWEMPLLPTSFYVITNLETLSASPRSWQVMTPALRAEF